MQAVTQCKNTSFAAPSSDHALRMPVQLNSRTLLTSDAHSTNVCAMITFFAVFSVIVVGAGCLIAKLYEWRQDVLYGAYIAPERVSHRDDPERAVALGESTGQRSTAFSFEDD